jgi:WXXGXW repeat (2 copies)
MRIIRSIRSLLFALVIVSVSGASSAQVFVSVNFGPPALPVYEQPLCPAEDYIWLPGYWEWSPVGYYWVPGTWALAPEPGLLWTPGYWAFDDRLYYWHPGYWGPVVGYYGGIAYGYGYPGSGYYGGYWRGRQFYYNQTVNNVNVTNIHNVYSTTVVNNATTVNRVSYNGGPGGTTARPTPDEEAAIRQRQVPPTSEQMRHERAASTNHNLLASVNHGQPPIAATPKPAEFSGHGVIAASHAGAPYRAPENRAVPPRAGNPVVLPENRPENNPPRSETERRTTPAPRPEVPRPPSASERENAPRGENNPHPQREVRPENAPHPGKEPPQNRPTRPDNRTPPPNGDENRPH